MQRTHPNPLVLKGARQFRFPGNLSISSKVIQRRLDYWRQIGKIHCCQWLKSNLLDQSAQQYQSTKRQRQKPAGTMSMRYANRKETDMSKRSVVMILFVLAAVATVAMAADPWNGTWKLNPAKSTASAGRGLPHPSSINIIEIQGDTVHLIADETDSTGKVLHVEYTAKLDGKEYPVKQTPPPPNGQQYTISLKKIDARTREFVENIGNFKIKGRDILSEDGKSFSRVGETKDGPIQFFEKQ